MSPVLFVNGVIEVYYRMASNLILRGWKSSPWMLIIRPSNRARYLTREEFEVLLLCDGATEVVKEELEKGKESILDRLLKKKLVYETCEARMIESDQYYHYYDNRYVDSVLWSITGKCNFQCRHCYMDAPDGALGELDHDVAIDLIDQMAECGVLKVEITGGEPFVRNDFWELIDHLCERNILVTKVYTNGWLLTDKVLDEFEKRRLKPQFSLSFDGVGWHDWMRGVEGAEEAALDALKRCKERGFITDVEMCLHKNSVPSLRESIRVLAEAGVWKIKTGGVSPTELWLKNSEGNNMSEKEQVEMLMEYIPHYYEDGMPINLTLNGMVSLQKDSTEYRILAEKYDDSSACLNCYMCATARHVCYITPEGRLLPCMPMTAIEEQNMFPLIQDIGFKEGISGSFYQEYLSRQVRDLFEVNKKCDSCEHKLKCGGGCRAAALAGKDHDLMGCDYGQCMMFENGYPDKIRAVCDAAIAKYCPDANKDKQQ